MVEYQNQWFYVQKGSLYEYTGIVLTEGNSLVLDNGRLRQDLNGLLPFNGITYYFKNGVIDREAVGWTVVDWHWYYLDYGVLSDGNIKVGEEKKKYEQKMEEDGMALRKRLDNWKATKCPQGEHIAE